MRRRATSAAMWGGVPEVNDGIDKEEREREYRGKSTRLRPAALARISPPAKLSHRSRLGGPRHVARSWTWRSVENDSTVAHSGMTSGRA